jgi:hypothetical protein
LGTPSGGSSDYSLLGVCQEHYYAPWIQDDWRVNKRLTLGRSASLPPPKFVVTHRLQHSLPVYLKLGGEMVLTGIDQLWVADITYIRLRPSSFTWRWCWILLKSRARSQDIDATEQSKSATQRNSDEINLTWVP